MNIKTLSKLPSRFLAVVSLCTICAARIEGATVPITVGPGGSLTFSPASASANVGDTVTWTWPSGSNDHNVTGTGSPQGWTASSTRNGPSTFSITATTAGTYPYDCTIHAGEGMVASLTVSAPAVPPTVTVTNPAAGTVLSAPANITIGASAAAAATATISSVQFLVDSAALSTQTVSPYHATASNLATGSHTLTAIATDSKGLTATNSLAVSVVTPVPVTFSSLQQSAGTFQFSYTANAGLNYVVQKSTNLTVATWTSLATNQAAASSVSFLDSHATNNPAFYRVGRLPNP